MNGQSWTSYGGNHFQISSHPRESLVGDRLAGAQALQALVWFGQRVALLGGIWDFVEFLVEVVLLYVVENEEMKERMNG